MTTNQAAADSINLTGAGMLTAREVAALIRTGERAVIRKSAAGLMPAPVIMGRIRRWPTALIRAFVAGEWRPEPGK